MNKSQIQIRVFPVVVFLPFEIQTKHATPKESYDYSLEMSLLTHDPGGVEYFDLTQRFKLKLTHFIQ